MRNIVTLALLLTFWYIAIYNTREYNDNKSIVVSSVDKSDYNNFTNQTHNLQHHNNNSTENQKHNLTSILSFQEIFFNFFSKKVILLFKIKDITILNTNLDDITLHIFNNHKLFFSDSLLELIHYFCLIRI